MSESFLGEIRLFGFQFAPKGWALCNGQLLPINQNQALFSLLGTQYGGDGRVNFALPDLRSRTPLGAGTNFIQGQRAGDEAIALLISQIPAHTHQAAGNSGAGDSASPAGKTWAASSAPSVPKYAAGASPRSSMASNALANTGGGQPHNNMQPYLVLNFCIALQGIFPSRN